MGSFKLEFHVVLVQEFCSSSLWITFSSTCKSKFEEYFFCEWNTLYSTWRQAWDPSSMFSRSLSSFHMNLCGSCWPTCAESCVCHWSFLLCSSKAQNPLLCCENAPFSRAMLMNPLNEEPPVLVLFNSFTCEIAVTCARMQ